MPEVFDIDAAVSAYCRHLVEQAIEKDGDTAMAIAARAGIARSQVSQLQTRSRGAGLKTRRGIAGAFGRTTAQLETEALAWAKENPDQIIEWIAATGGEPRYPSRLACIRWARDVGYPPEAIAEVASIALDADGDPGADYWIDQLRAARARHELAKASRPSADGRPLSAAERGALRGKPTRRK